jgi:hypothetical protein
VSLFPRTIAAQVCSVQLDAKTLQPTPWEQIVNVVASFLPKPSEAKRLSQLRQAVQDLRKDKNDLKDTLKLVADNDSLQDWMKARVRQIPNLQDQIVSLLKKIGSEGDEGGLFAGDKSFAKLQQLIRDKQVALNDLCVLSGAPLPLSPADRNSLQSFISKLSEEIHSIDSVDEGLAKLIEKAQPKAGA